jgi:hypothetical protein
MHKAEGILGVVDTIGEFSHKPMVSEKFTARVSARPVASLVNTCVM